MFVGNICWKESEAAFNFITVATAYIIFPALFFIFRVPPLVVSKKWGSRNTPVSESGGHVFSSEVKGMPSHFKFNRPIILVIVLIIIIAITNHNAQ